MRSMARTKRKSPSQTPELPVLAPVSAAAWQTWLAKNHARSPGVLLRIPKKDPEHTLNYATAVESALAWGWIDSQKRALDASAWLQRFTPRTAQSPWSKINRDKATQLIAEGRMMPPGLREVERARADGRWARAYAGARTATVPPDLARALAEEPKARAFFEQLDGANRYAILYRVTTAKRPETRARRIQELVALCAGGKTIHPARKKKVSA
jgi:uncharacterized protein YdeI (YjbR/CyaY-like superfamily)